MLAMDVHLLPDPIWLRHFMPAMIVQHIPVINILIQFIYGSVHFMFVHHHPFSIYCSLLFMLAMVVLPIPVMVICFIALLLAMVVHLLTDQIYVQCTSCLWPLIQFKYMFMHFMLTMVMHLNPV